MDKLKYRRGRLDRGSVLDPEGFLYEVIIFHNLMRRLLRFWFSLGTKILG